MRQPRLARRHGRAQGAGATQAEVAGAAVSRNGGVVPMWRRVQLASQRERGYWTSRVFERFDALAEDEPAHEQKAEPPD